MRPMLSDLKSTYSRMVDEDLLVIVHSQMSFRPGAQDLAKEILLQRGISANDINKWRHPDAGFPIRSWSRGKSNLQLRRMFKRRRRLDKITFYLLMIINLPLLGISLYIALFNSLASWQIRLEALFSFFNIFVVLLWFRILLQNLSLRAPLRILLLRPFMFPDSRSRIRRFAKHYLRYLGHTYTVSDTEVKQRWALLESLQSLLPILLLISVGRSILSNIVPDTHDSIVFVIDVIEILMIDILLTGWVYLLFRSSFDIRCDAEVSRFKDFMSRKRARNIAWALSWDKLFKVTCTAQTWKYTVQQLINSSQLIIVDLSRVGENMIWELGELQFYNAVGKVVAIAHEKSAYRARSFLTSGGLVGFNGEVFVYKDSGLAASHEQLMARLTTVATSSLATNRS